MNNQPLSVSFAPYTRPTFASSTPPSNHLQITNVGQIPHILRELRADPNRANQITDVIIDEADWVEGDVEGDEGATPRAQEALSPSSTDSKSNDEVDTGSEIDNLDNDEAGATVAELLDEARSHNALQSFQWTGPNPWREGHRPRVFWDALWKSAATLKAVNLQFFEHELYYLHKYQEGIPFPPRFPRLELLYLNAGGAHGDNGSFLDRWLANSPALTTLDLRLPTCSLEDCRIQGITWDYDFPPLETFGLVEYSSDHEGLARFLRGNPTIKTLTLNLSTDNDSFALQPNSLPDLTSLSINFHGRAELVSSLALRLASTPLKHLRVTNTPHDRYLEFVKLADSLRCLELDLGSRWQAQKSAISSSAELEKSYPDANLRPLPRLLEIVQALLPQLPRLQELALDAETADTTIFVGGSGDERGWEQPDALDESDLKLVLRLLRPDIPIRALRLSDSRGTPLPAKLLDVFPDVPPSLDYVRWDVGTKKTLYRLERGPGEQLRAVECEPPSKAVGNGFWTENRVLDFED